MIKRYNTFNMLGCFFTNGGIKAPDPENNHKIILLELIFSFEILALT